MDKDDFKGLVNKVLKGCGCLSIGFFLLLAGVGMCVDDDEKDDGDEKSGQKTEQTGGIINQIIFYLLLYK